MIRSALRRAKLWVVPLLLGILATSGCVSAPPQATAPGETTTLPTQRPTHPPTYTAVPFELRPSATPAPTLTPIPFGLPATITLVPDPGSTNPGINPLTGKLAADPQLLERRPLLIKISNFPRSVRPQWGLNAADHVWEYYLEDELTRFVAVFYGQNVERVGPVRSARPFDEHLLRMYKGILTFGYADKRLMDAWVNDPDISPFMVIQKPDNCPPMCRIGPENSYNNLFADTAALSRYVTDRGTTNSRQVLEGLRFEAPEYTASGGETAERIEVRFSPMSYHYWEYRPDTRRYLRWQDADRKPLGEEVYQPLIDSLDGAQVTADNLILLMVPSEYIYVSTSTDVIQHRLEGSGTAYAFRDGRLFTVEWLRDKPRNLISLSWPNGRPYLLKPGTVWYIVLGAETLVTADGDVWRFIHSLPPVPTITPRATETPAS